MVRSAIAVTCLALSSVLANAADPRPAGRNCNVLVPPDAAGEDTLHGMIFRVFPRAKDIDSTYTGCQVLLASYESKWVVVSLTEIVKGDPVRIWFAHDKDGSRPACRYRNGKVVRGNPDTCPAPQGLLIKSTAPGCSQIISEAVAKQGLGATIPAECDYN